MTGHFQKQCKKTGKIEMISEKNLRFILKDIYKDKDMDYLIAYLKKWTWTTADTNWATYRFIDK